MGMPIQKMVEHRACEIRNQACIRNQLGFSYVSGMKVVSACLVVLDEHPAHISCCYVDKYKDDPAEQREQCEDVGRSENGE